MRLAKIHAQTYRSIVDSGIVDVDDGVTVMIGKNEQGKTTFLRAIHSFNSDQKYKPNDLPNHLRPALEDKSPAEIPIITLTFSLESADRKKLAGTISGIEVATALKATKFYDNHYQFWLVKPDASESPLSFAPPDISAQTVRIAQVVDDLKAKLQAHMQRLSSFVGNQEKIDQIATGIVNANFRDPAQVDNIIKTFTTR